MQGDDDNAGGEQGEEMGEEIRDTYDNVEDAIGEYIDPDAVVVEDVQPTDKPFIRIQGYKETWYVIDSEGTKWTVFRNPTTGKFGGAHHSGKR
jgi:hypothetical protein